MSLAPIGMVVLLGVILMPVYVTLAAWLFATPRDSRTAVIGIGYMAVIAVVMITATAALGLGFFLIDSLPL